MPIHHTSNRLGIHYYPDTFHYRIEDLACWLPRLEYLGVNWITLVAHPSRAIPEFFIRALVDRHITPVVHIPCRAGEMLKPDDFTVLFSCYANWGVQYIAAYDRPNSRSAWDSSSWSQTKLIERFVDRYLPIADTSLRLGMKPVLPPLEPGGDFWDLVFLREMLESFARRGCTQLLDQLVLSAYAWTYGKPLSWGAGGAGRWVATRPFYTPAGSEDQMGFHTYAWYLDQARRVLGHPLPVLILGAGCRISDPQSVFSSGDRQEWHANQNRLLAGWITEEPEAVEALGIGAPPNEILACNFWILAAEADHTDHPDAWFPANNRPLPVVKAFADLKSSAPSGQILVNAAPGDNFELTEPACPGHYILIPASEEQGAISLTELANPFAQRKKAAIGSCIIQALEAKRVTILGSRRWLDEVDFNKLRAQGCMIEEAYGDGTLIATKLAYL